MADQPATDETIARLDKLYPAVISDILDSMGRRNQVMASRVRPLYPEARVVGYASTVHATHVDRPPARQEDYYKLQMAAVDRLQPGEVLVVSTVEACCWGELFSTAARSRGGRGIVADGFTRDTLGIIAMQFPTFVTGVHCADEIGRIEVVDLGSKICSGGVRVAQGDLVIADFDGVVVIPTDIAEEVISRAEEKVSGESMVRVKLREGMPVSEAFSRYGIM